MKFSHCVHHVFDDDDDVIVDSKMHFDTSVKINGMMFLIICHYWKLKTNVFCCPFDLVVSNINLIHFFFQFHFFFQPTIHSCLLDELVCDIWNWCFCNSFTSFLSKKGEKIPTTYLLILTNPKLRIVIFLATFAFANLISSTQKRW